MLRPVLLIATLLLILSGRSSLGQDMPLADLLFPGQGWELVADGFRFTEGPAADAAGNVYFTDVTSNRIHKIDLQGKVSTFAEDTMGTNGLMFGPDGRLYGCQNGAKKIVAFDPQGKESTIAEGVESNDLVVTRAGGIYFTDPAGGRVWYIKPGGKPEIAAKDLRPNGVILWADQGTLVVTDSQEPVLWTFRVEADGSLTHKDRYYHPLQLPGGQTRPGSDGMTVDKAGRLYVATHVGLQVFDPTGRVSGSILKPQPAFLSNVVFGGPKLDTLFVTSSDKVYRRKTKATGVLYFQTPAKP